MEFAFFGEDAPASAFALVLVFTPAEPLLGKFVAEFTPDLALVSAPLAVLVALLAAPVTVFVAPPTASVLFVPPLAEAVVPFTLVPTLAFAPTLGLFAFAAFIAPVTALPAWFSADPAVLLAVSLTVIAVPLAVLSMFPAAFVTGAALGMLVLGMDVPIEPPRFPLRPPLIPPAPRPPAAPPTSPPPRPAARAGAANAIAPPKTIAAAPLRNILFIVVPFEWFRLWDADVRGC